MRNALGRFVPDVPADNRLPVGSIRIRTRHRRGGEQRAFVKIAEPNVWKLRAQVVWEAAHGPIAHGMGTHHRDRSTLNDELSNLELLSKSEHLAEHRPEHRERALAGFVEARRKLRWSTKSTLKRTGRHPNGCSCGAHRAK